LIARENEMLNILQRVICASVGRCLQRTYVKAATYLQR